jgi:hypothetical protein
LAKRKAAKRAPKVFYQDTYGVWICVLLGWEPDEAKAWLKKRYGFDHDLQLDKHLKAIWLESTSKDADLFIIHAGRWANEPKYLAALAHEAVHIASYIFRRAGARHDMENEEPYTYLVQNIFQHAIED